MELLTWHLRGPLSRRALGAGMRGGDLIREVFGSHVDQLAVSSTKSMTGHLLGAAGALEALLSIRALETGILPPTINLDTPGEDCDLDYVPGAPRESAIDVAVSNSFGFGGTNAVLVFRRFHG